MSTEPQQPFSENDTPGPNCAALDAYCAEHNIGIGGVTLDPESDASMETIAGELLESLKEGEGTVVYDSSDPSIGKGFDL